MGADGDSMQLTNGASPADPYVAVAVGGADDRPERNPQPGYPG